MPAATIIERDAFRFHSVSFPYIKLDFSSEPGKIIGHPAPTLSGLSRPSGSGATKTTVSSVLPIFQPVEYLRIPRSRAEEEVRQRIAIFAEESRANLFLRIPTIRERLCKV